jgi:hypothetical protein
VDTCFNAQFLDEKRGLRATPRGAEIDVRLPWYRSLPVSVIEVASLALDGKPVPPEDVRFEINGKSFGLGELASQTSEFWFVLDSAVLRLPNVRLQPGSDHDVELQLNVYPPYVPHLNWITRMRKTIRAL